MTTRQNLKVLVWGLALSAALTATPTEHGGGNGINITDYMTASMPHLVRAELRQILPYGPPTVVYWLRNMEHPFFVSVEDRLMFGVGHNSNWWFKFVFPPTPPYNPPPPVQEPPPPIIVDPVTPGNPDPPIDPAPVPEPSTWGMMAIAGVVLTLLHRRKQSATL